MFACSNNQKNDQKTSDATTIVKSEAISPLPQTYYKRLEGRLNGHNLVMHLQKKDTANYSAVYYTDGDWWSLKIDTIIGQDSIVFLESISSSFIYSDSPKQPKITLKWTGNDFIATRIDENQQKSTPFHILEKYPTGSYSFSNSIYKDSLIAFPGNKKSPKAVISFENLNANGSDANAAFLNQELKKIMDLPANQSDWHTGIKQKANKYFSDYKNDLKDLKNPLGADEIPFWMNYTSDGVQSVLFNDQDFVVVAYNTDVFTGGAHGLHGTLLYCFDVKNKKQLALSDLLKIEPNTLQKLVEQNFRKKYHIKPNEGLQILLFDNYLKPNKNFFFNANGISFLYNPYEVASYAVGDISVFIPFDELKDYLLPAFASRMGIK
ncbi:RsiV family protein [Pedobacter sp. MW01-1-1]|uniref:RsiV family protein n=1 Tax=Pedobacter sp. MW01-1-1 TaxID=3383027 RepID=UPI003FF03B34